jgi:hypothetical protein
LLEDLLPWCESWGAAIPSSRHRVRDPHDQVFLDLALAAATPVLVSGDADLLALKEEVVPLQIGNPAEAMAEYGLPMQPSLEAAGPYRGVLAAVAHHQFAALHFKGMAPRVLGPLRL